MVTPLLMAITLAASAGQQVKSGMAPVPEPTLYFEEAGQGMPVILIHGGQLDHRMWDEQFQDFAARFRTIRYDVRGYGRSPSPTRPFSMVDDLLALMNALAVDRAALVGLSLGGRIAIDFTLEHPERVAALLLAGPGLSGFDWSPESNAKFWAMVEAAQEEPAKAVEMWLKDPYMAPAMENPKLAERIRAIAMDNTRVWLDNPVLERSIKPPAAGRLASIKAPTLVIVGDRDVPDIQAIVKKLESEVAGSRKVVIRGAGHMVSMERPDEFNDAVLDFLLPKPARERKR